MSPTPIPSISPNQSYPELRSEVTLTSAEILALEATPVTIVPAPGAGLMIVPHRMVIKFIGGSVAYTNGSSGVSKFTVGDTVQNIGGSEAIWLVTVAPNKRVQILPWASTGTAGNPPTEDNAPLQIAFGTADLAAGNGIAEIVAYYHIEPTTN